MSKGVVPAGVPLINHSYEGFPPPLTGVGVTVTLVPEQIVVALAAILTLTGARLVTFMVMALEVAGLPVAQVAFEVITQVTTSLWARVVLA